jgi:hypothetical protein
MMSLLQCDVILTCRLPLLTIPCVPSNAKEVHVELKFLTRSWRYEKLGNLSSTSGSTILS